MPRSLARFPLLASPSEYFPDTQDLTADSDARDYWLTCFDEALDKVCVNTAISRPVNRLPCFSVQNVKT